MCVYSIGLASLLIYAHIRVFIMNQRKEGMCTSLPLNNLHSFIFILLFSIKSVSQWMCKYIRIKEAIVYVAYIPHFATSYLHIDVKPTKGFGKTLVRIHPGTYTAWPFFTLTVTVYLSMLLQVLLLINKMFLFLRQITNFLPIIEPIPFLSCCSKCVLFSAPSQRKMSWQPCVGWWEGWGWCLCDGGRGHCFDRLVCHCDGLKETRGQTADVYFLTASGTLAPGSLWSEACAVA